MIGGEREGVFSKEEAGGKKIESVKCEIRFLFIRQGSA